MTADVQAETFESSVPSLDSLAASEIGAVLSAQGECECAKVGIRIAWDSVRFHIPETFILTFMQLFNALQAEHRSGSSSFWSVDTPSSALFLTHGATSPARGLDRRPDGTTTLEPIPAANDNDPCLSDLHRSIG